MVSTRQVVQECFDGDRRRECNYCPGHHTKGGICCFGHKYEEDDAQCDCCPHNHSCEPATFEYMTHEESPYAGRPRRTTIPVRPARPSSSRRPVHGQASQRGDLIANTKKSTRRDPDTVEPVRFHERGFFEQMGLHAVWGAMEGAFEMLLGFLRNRRPD